MASRTANQVPVWDPVIRVFHWTLVVSLLLNYSILEDGDPPHTWVGYLVLVLLAVRIVWGFLGPQNARFRDFWPTADRLRRCVQQHLRGDHPSPDRHNPLGGLMILALLTGVLLTGITGWLLTWDMFWGESWLESLHELFAESVMTLACVHVVVVFLLSKFGPHNLIRTMLTGYREEPR